MIRAVPLLAALALAATPLGAQDSPPASQPPSGRTLIQKVSHRGKWLAAAGSATLIALGAAEHDRAQESWDALLAQCREVHSRCARGDDGTYADLEAERLYQEALHYDRRAQRRIVAGQIALAFAAAMFIVDLASPDGGPENVPFDPERAYVAPARGGGVLVGVRVGYTLKRVLGAAPR